MRCCSSRCRSAAPEQLVDVFTSDSTARSRFSTSSYPDYLDLKAQNEVFEDIVGYSPMFAALNLDNRSRLAMGEIVTGNYFQVLGVPAALGRTILPEDDRAGRRRAWRWSRTATGCASSGRRRTPSAARIRIRGNPYTIVGVAPPGFNGMVPVLSPEMWIPVSASLEVEPVGMHDTVPSPTGHDRLDRRGDRWLFMRGAARSRARRLTRRARTWRC